MKILINKYSVIVKKKKLHIMIYKKILIINMLY